MSVHIQDLDNMHSRLRIWASFISGIVSHMVGRSRAKGEVAHHSQPLFLSDSPWVPLTAFVLYPQSRALHYISPSASMSIILWFNDLRLWLLTTCQHFTANVSESSTMLYLLLLTTTYLTRGHKLAGCKSADIQYDIDNKGNSSFFLFPHFRPSSSAMQFRISKTPLQWKQYLNKQRHFDRIRMVEKQGHNLA